MLKNFFISMLGAIAGFWISMMLIVIIGIVMAVGAISSAFINSQQPAAELKDDSVLYISLDSRIEEYYAPVTPEQVLYDEPAPQTLTNLVRAINAAKEDRHIAGIYLECNGSTAGFATREALADALADFKSSGKWIMSYADSYTQGEYYLASCADHLYLNPIGSVDIAGLTSSIPFFKGLMDKVGVKMQVFKVGTYKSAVEPFILDNMSDANREMTRHFLTRLWSNLSGTIAKNRGVKEQTVNAWADSIISFADTKTYVDLKIVDGLKYLDEVKEELTGLVGASDFDDINLIDYATYNSLADAPHEKDNKNKIAVYYACGDITDNGTEGITAEKVVPDILDLADDDDIKALVLRVNSGGGSAYASEQIWHALEVFKSKGKTLYVSMGDYAASGGYYISCGAERIYAEPMTLTGSIGIFGMVPCAQELFNDKLGINFGIVSTSPNNAITITEPLNEVQCRKFQNAINRGYELFTSRCAEGRHITQDSIKAIAEGRVWDGRTALKIGLVDELGSLDDCISALAKKMKYKDYQVVVYPENEPTFWDMLADLENQIRTDALREELGAYYPVFLELKRLENMAPVQARMMPMSIH